MKEAEVEVVEVHFGVEEKVETNMDSTKHLWSATSVTS
jgi:hypothetical protein